MQVLIFYVLIELIQNVNRDVMFSYIALPLY